MSVRPDEEGHRLPPVPPDRRVRYEGLRADEPHENGQFRLTSAERLGLGTLPHSYVQDEAPAMLRPATIADTASGTGKDGVAWPKYLTDWVLNLIKNQQQ